jgi:hypothetical protein
VLLGAGTHFYTSAATRIELEPLSSTKSGSVNLLKFRVRQLS